MIEGGGYMDEVRKNVCMVGCRLEIQLGLCDEIEGLVVGKVVNDGKGSGLGGGNGRGGVNKGSKGWLRIIDKK